MRRDETIVAIATPAGMGAVAIIRLSGTQAFAIADRLFSRTLSSAPSHVAQVGTLHNIDKALALPFRAPKSYTGEDVVEFHCHGSNLIAQQVLQACIQAGAAAAHPGEFTLRAFLNGKLDLAQAEAVQQLISAQSAQAATHARNQLEGRLSSHIEQLQSRLFNVAAILEAWVDFPEEGIEFASLEEIASTLTAIGQEIGHLSATFAEGKKLTTAPSICLLGCPNVGKSSLLNALLGKERAIVTDIAGTTRDLIDEEMRLGDILIRVIDTAGLRTSDDVIEQEGMRRSKQAAASADAVLLVLDATRPLNATEEELLRAENILPVWNKADLVTAPHLAVSAKTGLGLETLKQLLLERLLPTSKQELIITQARHKEALDKASAHIASVTNGLSSLSPELLTSDMRAALQELSRIIGKEITEEILSAIFNQFCIGK